MNRMQYLKEFIKYTTSNVLGMFGLSCYILADTYFISKGLGANGLTALNLAIPVYSFIHGSGLMLGMGGATRYSIYQSQKKVQNANIIFTNVIYTTALLASIFLLMGLFLSEEITAALGADAEVFAMTNTYLKVIMIFAPIFMMNEVLICFVRNDGNPQLTMCAMLSGSLANIMLDYIFIFPMHLGIFGAVFATGFAPVISMSILSLHLQKGKNQFHLVKTGIDCRMILKTLSLGFPSLIAEVSSGIVIIVFNIIILRLQGNVGVAAYGVIANLSLVVVAIYTGVAQGTQPLISSAYGCGDQKNIRQILRYAMAAMLMISCVVYLAVFLFAEPITSIFNSENNLLLQKIAVPGLKLYFTSAVLVGFNIIISVYFTSIERAVPAHIISLLRGLLVIVPMAFLLAKLCGIIGVWLAFPVTELLVAILGVGLYFIKGH